MGFPHLFVCLARCHPNLDPVIFGGTISWIIANWLVWLYRKGKFPLHMSFRESMYHIYIYHLPNPHFCGAMFQGGKATHRHLQVQYSEIQGHYLTSMWIHIMNMSHFNQIGDDRHIKIWKIVTHNATILQSSMIGVKASTISDDNQATQPFQTLVSSNIFQEIRVPSH